MTLWFRRSDGGSYTLPAGGTGRSRRRRQPTDVKLAEILYLHAPLLCILLARKTTHRKQLPIYASE